MVKEYMLTDSKQRPRRDAGFTLLEIMVVVVIIGIMATVVAPQLLGRADEARITKVRADITGLEAALDLYRLDNYSYPTTNHGLQALVNKPTTAPIPKAYKEGGYIKTLPKDPWGRDYLYLQPGTKGKFYDLYSLGADGEEGGEDMNADITNWDAK